MKYSDVTWYTKTLTDIAQLKEEVIEIMAERTYSHFYNAKTYVVYTVYIEAQVVDELLTSKAVVNALTALHFTYISFKKSTSELIMKQLHWTQLQNRLVKYEALNNVYLHTFITDKSTNKC